ncbi:hypothetical protein CEXT_377781 [Caerostris extrusa]|uniref:Uncharacterized protein n=1 Tax=Caerostris extrusa TaxID=172846 RepID=A0AAV4S456_CAEEX|nr:hypothetical protein CEXT_377781 [Caerostris extrusa]
MHAYDMSTFLSSQIGLYAYKVSHLHRKHEKVRSKKNQTCVIRFVSLNNMDVVNTTNTKYRSGFLKSFAVVSYRLASRGWVKDRGEWGGLRLAACHDWVINA